MSVPAVTPVESVNLQSVTRQSREAAEAMAAAILAGDMAAAQRYLKVVQETQSISGVRAVSAGDLTVGGERRPGLGALMSAVQAGDMDRARSAVGKSGNSSEDPRTVQDVQSGGSAAPKVVDASNAGTVLVDLTARLNAALSGARSAVEVDADARNASGVFPKSQVEPDLPPNTMNVPGPGEEENGNTRYSGEAIRSKEQVLHSYSQYLAF